MKPITIALAIVGGLFMTAMYLGAIGLLDVNLCVSWSADLVCNAGRAQ